MGELYIVATPIGNLGDISQRAITVLAEVDVIAAEDTRHSKRLLQHLNIDRPMLAYHDHNEAAQSDAIISRLAEGQRIALISDAGTPLVSDPGYSLVSKARAGGYPVIPIPGPSAVIAALSVSGLPSDRFTFEGFLPAKANSRVKALQALADESRTLVFYESSHRIQASIDDMAEVFGRQRTAVIARELTKTFETVLQGSLEDLAGQLSADNNQQKGEFVVLVKGMDKVDLAAEADGERVLDVLLAELPVKQAASLAAKISGQSKNDLYKLALRKKAD